MFITTEVTQHDIRYGQPGSADKCAIARALRRTFPSKKFRVDVSGDGVEVTHTKSATYHCAKLPKKADDFIGSYDAEGKKAVKPFSFRLSFPKSFLALA